MDQRKYHVGAFARAAGVSIRALHHYDRLGLVSPAGRDGAGYRYYTARELVTLQQVLTLRYLGFPLARIGELMRSPGFDIEASLRAQRQVLRERVVEIEDVSAALDRMLEAFERTGAWQWSLVADASNEASKALARKGKTMDQATMMERFRELHAQVDHREREEFEQRWTALFAEVEANLHLSVTDPRAVAFADRWDALRKETEAAYTTRGFGDLWQAIGEAHREGTLPSNPHAPSQASWRVHLEGNGGT